MQSAIWADCYSKVIGIVNSYLLFILCIMTIFFERKENFAPLGGKGITCTCV